MTTRKVICLLLLSISISLPGSQTLAQKSARTEVKTILASNEKGETDLRLKDLARELQSVFRYSSYQLLSRDRLNLNLNRSEKISLPGGRMMTLTLKGISGDRATIQLEILKGDSKIFQSVIQLRNNSSVTVGGPNYKGGYLLFNIYNSF